MPARPRPHTLVWPWTAEQVAMLDSMLDDLFTDLRAVADVDLVITDVTGNNVSSSRHGFAPKSPGDLTKFLNGGATPDYAKVKDSDLSLSDIVTNDASITKHGFVPKLPNDAAKFLNGVGGFSSVSSSTTVQSTTLTGTQNNFDLTSAFTHLRVNSASAVTFTGFTVAGGAPTAGNRVIIDVINAAAEPVTFPTEDPGSTAANRLIVDQLNEVAKGVVFFAGRIELIYDGTSSRWRMAGFDGADRINTVLLTTTGNIDDLAFRGTGMVRMNNGSLATIRGMMAGRNGQLVTIMAVGAGALQIANQDTNSSAANRIITLSQGTEQGRVFTLNYDAQSARWRQVTWGPSVVSGRGAAKTAAQASVAAITVGAVDASFEVSANVLVTTATTHNFTVTVAYTDEGNTARTLTLTFSKLDGTLVTGIVDTGGAVPYSGVPQHIRAKSGTTITIATVGTFTTVTYNVEGVIKHIAT